MYLLFWMQCPYIYVHDVHLFLPFPQGKYQEVESKYKDAMVTSAQLYNDKTQLVYHVESLKDK